MRLLFLIMLAWLCPQWAVSAENAQWQPIFGDAVSLVGTAESVYAVGQDGSAWQWQPEDGFWGRLPGEFKHIKAMPKSNKLWAISLDGDVLRYTGLAWEALGFKALDIAPTAQGDLYWVQLDGAIRKQVYATLEQTSLAGTAKNIAIANDGSLWSRSATGDLAQWTGNEWKSVEGKARYLTTGLDGSIEIISEQGEFKRWDSYSKNWRVIPTPPDVKLATNAFNNTLWVSLANGTMVAQGTITKTKKLSNEASNGSITINRRGNRGGGRGGYGRYGNSRRVTSPGAAYIATTPSSSITDPDPFTFVDTRSDGKSIAIGTNGSVFSLGKDQLLYQWSNAQQTFKSFPGSLTKIAVDPNGNPWGINQYGRIFRHDSADWKQVTGLASDIAIGANGRIIIANDTGELSEYVSDVQGFRKLPALSAYFIAVAKDGTPWGLLKDGTVVRCGQTPCERLPKQANSIAIGPDNSVFIVTAEGRLELYRAATDDWQVIPVNGLSVTQVAVGPKGRPWVVATDGSILYSAQFPRDESTDIVTAVSTKTPTTGTGDTATVTEPGTFVINKNLLFGSVASTLTVLTSVTVGQDGTVLGTGYSDALMTIPAYEKYDSTAKKMFAQTVNLPDGDQFKTVKADTDGSLWFLSLGTNGRLYHKVNGAFFTLDVFEGTTFCAVGVCPIETSILDLDIAPDGGLYVIVGDGSLYYKSPTATKFSKLIPGNYKRVAVSRTGDVWVMTIFASTFKQVINGVAVTRSMQAGEIPLDIAGSANGNVYVVYSDGVTSKLARWNATSQSFDKVSRTASAVAVTPNGRPWVVDELTNPGILFYAK